MSWLELTNLITIRDFAVKIFDNVYFKMSNEEVNKLRNKIAIMDRVILDGMLNLNLNIETNKLPVKTK
jgi:hypothetical protein